MKKLRLKRILVIFLLILVWYGINFCVLASGYEGIDAAYDGSGPENIARVDLIIVGILKKIIIVFCVILGVLSIEKINYIVSWLKDKENVHIKLDRESFLIDCLTISGYTLILLLIYGIIVEEFGKAVDRFFGYIAPFIVMFAIYSIPGCLASIFAFKLKWYNDKTAIKNKYKKMGKNNKEWLEDEKWLDYNKKYKRISKILCFMWLITLLLLMSEIAPFILMFYSIPCCLASIFAFKLKWYNDKTAIKNKYKKMGKNNKEWLEDEKWLDYNKKYKRISKILFFMWLITLLLLIRFLHLLS